MTKLKNLRKERNLKLREVGERLGVTAQCVRIQEVRGINKMNTAKKYATALNCNPFDLLEG